MKTDKTSVVRLRLEMSLNRAISRNDPLHIRQHLEMMRSPVVCTFAIKETFTIIDSQTREQHLHFVTTSKINSLVLMFDTLWGAYLDQAQEDNRKPWWHFDWI